MTEEYLDILFLHRPAMLGEAHAILDADVAYSHQFVAFPVGILNMSHNLEMAGYKVKIVNLGERMLGKKPDETLEDLVKQIFIDFLPRIIGIDIHWWVHSAGALETARLIKNLHPEVKIVLGGITASFNAEEILKKYQQVDFVMIGECDQAIIDFVGEINNQTPNLSKIPNLAYRDLDTIRKNAIKLPNLEAGIELTRYEFLADKPIVNQDRSLIPITRGCTQKCCHCSAADKSFHFIMHREKMGMLSPDNIVRLIKSNKEQRKDKIYIYGDIRDGGKNYVDEFFSSLYTSGVTKAHLVLEFFYPPSEDYIKRWKEWADKTGNTLEATFSPESGNEVVRKRMGKNYSNNAVLESCKLVINYGIPLSVYFLLGFPDETAETVEETLNFSETIVAIYAERFKKEDLRHQIIGYEFMQIPDQGSSLHLNPEKYGYKLHYKNFEELVNFISSVTHWSQLVRFSTRHFTQDELVEKYYELKQRIYMIYNKYGLISNEELKRYIENLEKDMKFVSQKEYCETVKQVATSYSSQGFTGKKSPNT